MRLLLLRLAAITLAPIAWTLQCRACRHRRLTPVIACRRRDGELVLCWRCSVCEGMRQVF